MPLSYNLLHHDPTARGPQSQLPSRPVNSLSSVQAQISSSPRSTNLSNYSSISQIKDQHLSVDYAMDRDSHQQHRRLPSLQTILSPPLEQPPTAHYSTIPRPSDEYAPRYRTEYGPPRPLAYGSFNHPPSGAGLAPPPPPPPPPPPSSSTSHPLPPPTIRAPPVTHSLPPTHVPSSPQSRAYTYAGRSPPLPPVSYHHHHHHHQHPLHAPPSIQQHPPPPPPPSHSQHANVQHSHNATPPSQIPRHMSPVQIRPADSAPRTPTNGGPRDAADQPERQPKVVGTRIIEGMGECYLYDNGTYLQCSIAGEPVNPNWGVTKAGKPRKRLAQACMACREKKVKCPLKPGQVKCDHCAKANRDCIKPPTHRTSPEAEQADQASTPGDSGRTSDHPMPPIKSELDLNRSKKRSGEFLTVQGSTSPRGMSPAWAETVTANGGLKRHKSQNMDQNWGSSEDLKTISGSNTNGNNRIPTPPRRDRYLDSGLPDTTSLSWDREPFNDDPKTTERLIRLYFSHRGRSPYNTFLEEPFIDWALNNKEKTRDDRMVLYAVLALGARFSSVYQEQTYLSVRLAQVVQHAVAQRNGKPSHQLAQARFYLCLWHFSRGDNELGWEYLTAGYSTVGALNLNTEEGAMDVDDGDDGLFGLNLMQLVECRRRTFWIGYLIDRVFYLQDHAQLTMQQQRYIGFAGGHIATFNDADVLVRLPQDDEDYASRVSSKAPFYHDFFDENPSQEVTSVSDMALLVMIVSVWGELTAHMYRTRHRPTTDKAYLDSYNALRVELNRKLNRWHSFVPTRLQFNPENTKKLLNKGRFSFYFIIHSVALVTSMKMNRFGRHDLLSTAQVKSNIKQACGDARALLTMISQLSRAAEMAENYSDDIEYSMAQPFPGYALLAACDIVSIGGVNKETMQTTTDLLSKASFVLGELSRFWFTAGKQKDCVNTRLKQLSAKGMQNTEGQWRNAEPIDGGFLGLEHDLVYGVPQAFLKEVLEGP